MKNTVLKIRYFIIIGILFNQLCSPPGNIRRNQLVFFDDRRNEIFNTAINYLGVPYKKGGATAEGFDCSGFTLFAYKKSGYNIPRSAPSQYYSGRRISLKYAKPGDLVFFAIDGGRISHVGIYAGNNEFIHSPGTGKSVSYAKINIKYWARRYIGAVTYFADRKEE